MEQTELGREMLRQFDPERIKSDRQARRHVQLRTAARKYRGSAKGKAKRREQGRRRTSRQKGQAKPVVLEGGLRR